MSYAKWTTHTYYTKSNEDTIQIIMNCGQLAVDTDIDC
jgi:hypothetical protein